MSETFKLLASITGVIGGLVSLLYLWQWIVDKRKPQKIDSFEDAFEAALDEHGVRFKEDRLLRLGPIAWATRRLRRWEKEEEPKDSGERKKFRR